MGKMTDALKKARMIKEGKLPSTARTDEPPAQEDAPETPVQPRVAPKKPAAPAPPVPAREKIKTELAPTLKPAGILTAKESPKPGAPARKRASCVTALEPSGVSAEEFRALKQKVLRGLRMKRPGDKSSNSRIILVTGPASGEGKTTVAANLALALGENADFRVLLVDANLPKPQIPALFGLPSGPGLAEMLLGRASIEESTVATDLNSLWVMGAGQAQKSPEELMVPNRVKEVLGQLASVFRYVVVDAPAPALMRQTAELAPAADAILLVLKRARSSKRDAREAIKLIRNRGAEILGCVMVD